MESVESSKRIHPRKLKAFVRHICVMAKRHKDREDARSELQIQLKSLKRFSSKKKEMDQELRELDRKISLVLDSERKLLGTQEKESAASRDLMNKVVENKKKIDQINNSLNDIKERLIDYKKIKSKREKIISDLDKKIKSKVGKKSDAALKTKLDKLEAMYSNLKKKGVNVNRVKHKIDYLKLRLND